MTLKWLPPSATFVRAPDTVAGSLDNLAVVTVLRTCSGGEYRFARLKV